MNKKFIFIILLVLLLGIVFFIISSFPKPLSKQEREKALAAISNKENKLVAETASKNYILYKGKYFTFMYPDNAKIFTDKYIGQPRNSSILDNFMFDLGAPRVTVVTQVVQANSSIKSVADDSGVRLRQIEPKTYKQESIKIGSQNGILFSKQDKTQFEKTAFFYLNNRIYTITVFGSSKEGVGDIFSKIVLSYKFL